MITTAVSTIYVHCSTILGAIQIIQALRLGMVLGSECHGSVAHSSKLNKMGINHDMKPLPLPNHSMTLSNAEFINKQFIKYT
jgi:hypothetical protein